MIELVRQQRLRKTSKFSDGPEPILSPVIYTANLSDKRKGSRKASFLLLLERIKLMAEQNIKNKNSQNKNALREIYEWLETFCVALCVVVIFFTFVCRFVTVDGHSMDNTLSHMDRLVVSDLFYTAKHGDIVVVHDINEKAFNGPIIKRVIALEGETVDIDPESWTVTVTDKDGNTRIVDEPYVNKVDAPMELPEPSYVYPHAVSFPHTVDEGCVFVMGDNRNYSADSRYVGDIDKRMIIGKAYLRLFPFNKIGFLN